MQKPDGYMLVERDVIGHGGAQFYSHPELYDYRGVFVRKWWPLDVQRDEDPVVKALLEERHRLYTRFNDWDAPVMDMEYIGRYIRECGMRNISLDMIAANVDEELVLSEEGRGFVFMGYDCIAEQEDADSYFSYIWSDGLAKDECRLYGWEATEFGLLSKKVHCDQFGRMRRECLNRGENWEELGPEKTVGYAYHRIEREGDVLSI